MMRVLAEGLLHLFCPGVCCVCEGALPPDRSTFCAACAATLTTDPYLSCPHCGETVGPYVELEQGCTYCRDRSFAFTEVVRLGRYEGPLRDVVLRLKNAHNEGLAEDVGMLWAEHAVERLRAVGADVVVPVPLHWVRWLWRGYNQAGSLAWGLAHQLGVPVRSDVLRRVRHTPRQTSQTKAGRVENVKNAFRPVRGVNLKGRTVLLVDDVMKTGSTAHEAARALRTAGAGRVVAAVLARAPADAP